jgi:hypothetical protein
VVSEPAIKDVVENAIQKAIDEALSKVTETTDSITISVAAGTYNGDIVIGTSKSVDKVTTTTYKDSDGNVLGTTEAVTALNPCIIYPALIQVSSN